jgi:TonB family protein
MIAAAKDGMKEVRIMRRYFGGALVGGLAAVVAAIAILWVPADPMADLKVGTTDTSAQRPAYYRIGEEGTVAPALIHERKPYYTPEAMHAKIQGEVVLGCVVQTDGVCSDVRVTKSLDPNGLDLQAINAVQEWRFEPGTRMGEPVPVLVDIAISFTLR